MGLGYGYEKLTSGAHRLVESGNLLKRLENAFMEFHPVTAEDLSAEHYQRYNDIYRRFTSQDAKGDAGTLGTTLETMNLEQQEKLADDILGLAFDVNAEYNRMDD